MVLCRFFQQGYCRFGNNCRFEHSGNNRQLFTQASANNNYYGSSNSAYNSRSNVGQSNYEAAGNNRFAALASNTVDNRAKNSYGGQSNVANSSGTTFADFVLFGDIGTSSNSVIQELEIGIKGNQWPFSCFGPQKEGDNWPGLEDMSPEELRFEAYSCQQAGRPLDAYIQGVAMLKNAQIAKSNELKSRTPAVLELLRKLYQGQKLAESGSFSAPFGQQGQSGGSSSIGPSQFRFSLDQQPFGQNSSPQQQQAAIVPASQFNQTPAIFGGAASLSTNAWSTPQAFGPATSSPTTNAFTANSFQAPSSFTLPTQQSQQQQQPQAQNVVFGGVQEQQSAFGGGSAPLYQAPLSATPIAQSPNSNNICGSTYTPLVVLTDDEKQEFRAQSFTPGNIPIRPPAMEFC